MNSDAPSLVGRIWQRLLARHGARPAGRAGLRWKPGFPNRTHPWFAPGREVGTLESDLLELLFETSAAFLAVIDRDGKILAANRTFAAALGRNPAEMTGLYSLALYEFTERELQEERERLAAIATLPSVDVQRRFNGKLVRRIRSPAGEVRSIEWTSAYAAAPDGSVEYWVCLGIDVTDRIEAVATLRASEARLAEAQRVARIGSWERDLATGRTEWSEELFRILELDPSRAAPGFETFLTVVHPDDRDAVRMSQAQLTAAAPVLDTVRRLLMPDGRVKYVREQYRVAFGPDGSALRIAGTTQDITDQRHKDAQLARMAAAVEHSGDGLIISDREGVIEYVNPAFESISGYARGEVVGASTRILRSGKQDLEFYRTLWTTLLSGKVWQGRYTNARKDGRLHTVDSTIAPIRDASGEITHFVAVYRDVTNRIQMEERLHRSARLEAIGALAGGIAHDLNNLLTPVLGYAELLQHDLSSASSLSALVDPIVQASRRARDLIGRILLFGRRTDTPSATIPVAPIVAETLALLRPTIPFSVQIRHNVAPDVGLIHANATHLHEVLMNLCINAVQAMPEGGTLTLTVDNAELHELRCYVGKLVSGSFVRLSVSDTGMGMSEEVMSRMFEPFFSTKDAGKGTGLGLSTVFGIVQEWGGALDVQSRSGQGSTFIVYIPRDAVGLAEPAPESALESAPPRGTESVMVVDDDPAVAGVVQRMLEMAGYRVQAFHNPAAALAALRETPCGFDLVVSDYMMPDLRGDQFAQAAHQISPRLPILLCTGATEQFPPGDLARMGIAALIHKPVGTSDLLREVRFALERQAAHAPA